MPYFHMRWVDVPPLGLVAASLWFVRVKRLWNSILDIDVLNEEASWSMNQGLIIHFYLSNKPIARRNYAACYAPLLSDSDGRDPMDSPRKSEKCVNILSNMTDKLCRPVMIVHGREHSCINICSKHKLNQWWYRHCRIILELLEIQEENIAVYIMVISTLHTSHAIGLKTYW